MLNKIKIIGKVLPVKKKEKDSEKSEPTSYLSLLVPNPSGSLTILRCVVQGEKVEEIEREIQEDEVLEIKGYLRNENFGRQILIKVMDFTKLDITSDKIDSEQSNQVRLIGRIITELDSHQRGDESGVFSFKISVPRERNNPSVFFCRVQGKLIMEFSDKLKKGDIILLEGFLQTKKIEAEIGFGETERKFSRISSIICQAFTLLDNDSASHFNPPKELVRIAGEVEKIDFTKPKKERHWEEKITE